MWLQKKELVNLEEKLNKANLKLPLRGGIWKKKMKLMQLFFVNANGNKGVAYGIKNIQKLRERETL